jgi:pyruvate/2-oxoglutarate dehydrogenase complex dihydrolipoamide acyltransferase (E2) component
MPDVAGMPASGPMEDFLVPDRTRIAAALRSLTRIDRAPRVNGRGFSPPAPVDSRPMTDIAPASSVVEIDLAHASDRMQADRDTWRQRGLEPSYTALFVDALLQAVRQAPQANATFEATGIRRYPAVHLAVSLTNVEGTRAVHGVIRDADTRNLLGLAVEIERIRAVGASQLLDESATLSFADYGPDSALYAVPVVPPGQVAAVRVGAVEERLVVRDRGFALSPTAFVCASIDHRALDGQDAGALLMAMKRHLEQIDVPA